MSVAIKVENLSKRFLIRHQRRERYATLRDSLASGAGRLIGRMTGKGKGDAATEEEFWALRDVDFEIRQGERVGIIGRNGAGKSTLLKILSRITDPTVGRIRISGKMTSLLEVGTGFHPELTGRENIFLNGAILGMTRAEIQRKFDEIVDFAEVEKFLDTPVKRYSSGMYVRLAFAVGANLDPDILVVDEVLAVGDVQFQRKCLGKMEEAGRGGRTVLFVSHSLPTILQLCPRALLLDGGKIVTDGDSRAVVETYLDSRSAGRRGTMALDDLKRALPGFGERLRFVAGAIVDANGNTTERVLFGEPLRIRMALRASVKLDDVSLVIGVDAQGEIRVTTLLSEDEVDLYGCEAGATFTVTVAPRELCLAPGRYFLTLGARRQGAPLDHLPQALHFDVDRVPWRDVRPAAEALGMIHLDAEWSASPALRVVSAEAVNG